MISVISVYNDKCVLDAFLLKSLRRQDTPCETVLVDNRQQQFVSASHALNHGASQATGDYLMFVHQDVELGTSSWLRDAELMLDAMPDLGIAGVAGARRSSRGGCDIVTNITHGNPPRAAGSSLADHPEVVQTLDECLVIVPRTVYRTLQFDEALQDRWHLYAVDYSLCVARTGRKAYVMPLSAYHRSGGVANATVPQVILHLGPYADGYYQALSRLLRKHQAETEWIYTTTGTWSTRRPFACQRTAALFGHLAYRVASRLMGRGRAQRLASAVNRLRGAG